MGDKKVKGSLLVDYVKMIRANRDRDWNRYLKPEDWEIINERVLPSMWYPLALFKRLGLATFYVLGEGKLERVHAWGKISMEMLGKGIYKSMIADAGPVKAVERFAILSAQFFNFVFPEVKKQTEKSLIFSYNYDPTDRAGYETYNAQLCGMLEHLVEMAGGKEPKIVLTSKEWQGSPRTEMDISWQ